MDIVYLDDDGVNGPGSIPSISDRLQVLNVKCAELQLVNHLGLFSARHSITFSMRMAKEQFESQKWQAFDLSEMKKDLVISITSVKRCWEMVALWLVSEKTWLEPISELSVSKPSQLDARVVVGCLARTEKMANVRYLNAICEILANNENVLFLWTGREEVRFSKYFGKRVSTRRPNILVGWMLIYMLEFWMWCSSLSFRNGNSILAAMQAGVPVLMWKSSRKQNLRFSFGSFLDETLDQIGT